MAARKTIDVMKVLKAANHALKHGADDILPGTCGLIEFILMESGNYRGYNYEGGYRPDDPDFNEYRRYYYGDKHYAPGTGTRA